MKEYIKPELEIIALVAEEQITLTYERDENLDGPGGEMGYTSSPF